MTFDKSREDKILSRKWFYRFQLPSGRVTECYLQDSVAKIHDDRDEMMHKFLEVHFQTEYESLRCIDLACHEGFFALSLAKKGYREVIGVDARQEHVNDASLMRDAMQLENVTFQVGDLQHLEPQPLGKFDVTLLFGIMYHLENPIAVLRLAQNITRNVCLIETQIAPNMTGIIDTGSYLNTKQIFGCFALVDESDELATDNKEANLSSISLIPSLPGLLRLLEMVGFQHIQILQPLPNAYEQFKSGKRVVIAALNDHSDS